MLSENLSQLLPGKRHTKVITEAARNKLTPLIKIGLLSLKTGLTILGYLMSPPALWKPYPRLPKKMVIELRSKYESKEDINALKKLKMKLKAHQTPKRSLLAHKVLVNNMPPKKTPKAPLINSFPENFNCGPLFFLLLQGEKTPLPPMTTCENILKQKPQHLTSKPSL